jgi:hypothetical protein
MTVSLCMTQEEGCQGDRPLGHHIKLERDIPCAIAVFSVAYVCKIVANQ